MTLEECWSNKRFIESNAATSNMTKKDEDKSDIGACIAMGEVVVFTTVMHERIDYKTD